MPVIITNKQDNTSTLPADEWNDMGEGLNNLATSTGQTPTEGENAQYSQAMAQYSSDGDYYVDSGSTTDTYVAITQNSRAGLLSLVAGVQIRFIPAASNTAADPTINVNGLGAKIIKGPDGSDISAGDFKANDITTLFYDGTYFRLTSLNVSGFSTGDEKYTMLSSAPSGWLFEEGQELSRVAYANLWNWANGNGLVNTEANWQAGEFGLFSDGDGSTTFRLPDMRGQFIRVQDNGAGIDPDAASRSGADTNGSVQSDAFQGHYHSQNANTTAANLTSPTDNYLAAGATAKYDNAFNTQMADDCIADAITDGTNGTPRTSSETRPVNIYRKLIIKT